MDCIYIMPQFYLVADERNADAHNSFITIN